MKYIRLLLLLFIAAFVTEVRQVGAGYNNVLFTTSCKCRTTIRQDLINPNTEDTPDDQNSQDLIWAYFKTQHPLLVDDDRVGKATKKYNCHSFVFNGSNGFIPSPAAWWVTSIGGSSSSGCWLLEPTAPGNGSVYSESNHSCLIHEELGKCGIAFLCKNNSKVYGTDMPYTVWRPL